ncbi:MAG TPA: nucleotidyltransferase domain-containing protein [Patescibacteria group bacterium]|nr:nucleotidyltransferase domain-containing protein [Patescibacteria group bacterium]
MNKQNIQHIVMQYISNLKHHGIPVKHVFIFGSSVRGKTHAGSDIDTCIISPIFGKDRQKERIRLMNLRHDVNDRIEPHPYSEADFQNPYDSFSVHIKKTGIKIV